VAHRDFSANLDEALKNRPSFTLNGVDFLCKPGLQWKTLAKAGSAIDSARGDPEDIEAAMLQFFDVVLVKTARPKMHELLEAEDTDDDDETVLPISIKQLSDIVQWLIEQYTGRPTQPSSDSSDSPNGTGETSREATSSTEAVTSPG
jgi:hypothetical protein